MRLRFLGAPRITKSSRLAVGSAAACKGDLTENAEAKTVSPSTSANDAAAVPIPIRQLRQRRVGVGLWAIRRQKLERAQLRPRIVVHMSRLRGRKTVADFGNANLRKKRKPCRSSSANDAPHTITSDVNSATEVTDMRNGTNVIADTRMDTGNGFKHEQLEEDGVRDDTDTDQMKDKEGNSKTSADTVNVRPKRHILHKNMVSVCLCVIKISKQPIMWNRNILSSFLHIS